MALVLAIALVIVPTVWIIVVTWRTLGAVEVALPQTGLDDLRELNIVVRELSALNNRLDLARIAPANLESVEKLKEANDFVYIRFIRQDFSNTYPIFPELPPAQAAMKVIIDDIDEVIRRGPPMDPTALTEISGRVKAQSAIISQFYYRFTEDTQNVLYEQQRILSWFRYVMVLFLLVLCALSGAAVGLLINRTSVLRRIRHISKHDVLTGLPNRAWFVENFVRMIPERGNKLGLGLLLLDLDRFKDVNDTFGHLTGDLLLKEAARRFTSSVRAGDIVVRLAGDEFAIIAPQLANRSDAASLARRIVYEYSGMANLQGYDVPLSCSIGVAVWPADGEATDELLAHADLALYAAKHAGRGRFYVYEPALSEVSTNRMAMESAIARALKAKEFSLVWQPQVSLLNGQVDGVEVLVRWFDPKRSAWIAPSDFIPIAERSDLIFGIDDYVLRAACLQGAAIQAALGRPLRISVNISGGNFERPVFPKTVAETLSQTGYPAGLLELEITEGVLIRNRQVSKAVIDELAELGIRVALDDFGTGYSSLSYFADLRLDRLKIDRSFLSIDDSGRKQSIVQAIIQFARAMHLETVGEGVETTSQLEALARAGCTSAQGFFISPPLTADEFIVWCQHNAGGKPLRRSLRLVSAEEIRTIAG